MLGEKHVCVWRAHRHGRKGHTGGWGPAQLGTHCGKTRIYKRECHGVMVHSFRGLTSSLLFVKETSSQSLIITPFSLHFPRLQGSYHPKRGGFVKQNFHPVCFRGGSAFGEGPEGIVQTPDVITTPSPQFT